MFNWFQASQVSRPLPSATLKPPSRVLPIPVLLIPSARTPALLGTKSHSGLLLREALVNPSAVFSAIRMESWSFLVPLTPLFASPEREASMSRIPSQQMSLSAVLTILVLNRRLSH